MEVLCMDVDAAVKEDAAIVLETKMILYCQT